MQRWELQWDRADRDVERRYPNYESPEATQARDQLNADYTRSVQPLFASANAIREAFLAGAQPTPDDQKGYFPFAKVLAGTAVGYRDMRDASTYMDSLVQRFVPDLIDNQSSSRQAHSRGPR